MAVADVLSIEATIPALPPARSRSSKPLPACVPEPRAPECPGKKRLSAPLLPATKRGKENAAESINGAEADASALRGTGRSPSLPNPTLPEPAAPAPPPAFSLAELAAALADLGVGSAHEDFDTELDAVTWDPPRPAHSFVPVVASELIAARRCFCPSRMFASAPIAAQ